MKNLICYFKGHKPIKFFRQSTGTMFPAFTREGYEKEKPAIEDEYNTMIRCDRCGGQLSGVTWFDDVLVK